MDCRSCKHYHVEEKKKTLLTYIISISCNKNCKEIMSSLGCEYYEYYEKC